MKAPGSLAHTSRIQLMRLQIRSAGATYSALRKAPGSQSQGMMVRHTSLMAEKQPLPPCSSSLGAPETAFSICTHPYKPSSTQSDFLYPKLSSLLSYSPRSVVLPIQSLVQSSNHVTAISVPCWSMLEEEGSLQLDYILKRLESHISLYSKQQPVLGQASSKNAVDTR